MGKHVYTYDNPPSEKHLKEACRILENGGVIAYPTDFNWAFGWDATSSKALSRIERLKPNHPKGQPFSLLCSSIAMAATVGIIETNAYRLLRKALPGPFTILLKPAKGLAKQLHEKRKTVGIRIPQNALILALVEKYGRPIVTSSVPHLKDDQSPKMGYEVHEAFGHAIDMILDLGNEVTGLESTIIDFTDTNPVLVRLGVGDASVFDL
jgi:tRNA threonylcarbamoyl adenosine modification protein (Sua5/YciO/YrdC/YwlC family)